MAKSCIYKRSFFEKQTWLSENQNDGHIPDDLIETWDSSISIDPEQYLELKGESRESLYSKYLKGVLYWWIH